MTHMTVLIFVSALRNVDNNDYFMFRAVGALCMTQIFLNPQYRKVSHTGFQSEVSGRFYLCSKPTSFVNF